MAAVCLSAVRITTTANKARCAETTAASTRTSEKTAETTPIAAMAYSAVMVAVFRNLRKVAAEKQPIAMQDSSVGEDNAKMAAARELSAEATASAAMALAVRTDVARPRTVATQSQTASMIANAIKASGVSKAVAFARVAVATRVCVKTTTTVVMANCVTIKAADKRATTTSLVPKASNAEALGLGARSVWSPSG